MVWCGCPRPRGRCWAWICPLIGEDVTVEQLLAHRSGIGDYVDEQAGHEVTDYVLTVPAQDLAATQQYLAVLDGQARSAAPWASASSKAVRRSGFGEIMVVLSNSDEPRTSTARAMWFRGSPIRADYF
jgi:hypothetical protein